MKRMTKTTGRMLAAALIETILIAATATFGAAQTPNASAQTTPCERGRPPMVSFGVGTFHCPGGRCVINGIYAGQRSNLLSQSPLGARLGGAASTAAADELQGTDMAWDFTVEPSLWEIRPTGPGAGRLEEGDVLLAVDGVPITTREAGRILSSLEPGAAVDLRVRRDGRPVRVEVTAEESCESYRVSTGPTAMPHFLERDARGRVVRVDRIDRTLAPIPEDVGRVRLEGAGVVLAGATSIEVGEGGTMRWRFTEDPVVAEVTEGGPAARAGIVPGEILYQVGETRLTTYEGAEALEAAGPTRPVLVMVRRGNSHRQLALGGG